MRDNDSPPSAPIMASMNHEPWDSPLSPVGPEIINIEGNPEAFLSGRGLGTSTPFTQHDNAAVRHTAIAIRATWLITVANISRVLRALELFLMAFAPALFILGIILILCVSVVVNGPHWNTAGPGLFFSGYLLMVIGVVGVVARDGESRRSVIPV
ncbi:hypothetical protein BKA56DRAFT_234002 [Ilyonectria sp. MPI-CAGE-AT-0026]|nr:hypothetical protein BKA56DRAFT_234002 [Ilyonectria sp. MPI-CAGE-AT-0026]